jgi:fatty-acyl-CoA synthase
MLDEIERNSVSRLSIVGDAFARPILRALAERRPDSTAYHCESLRLVTSSGAAWTASAKAAFFDYLPNVALMESCGATEGVSYGIQVSRLGDAVKTGSFLPVPHLILLDENLDPLPLQTGVKGLLASPTLAAGYLNDPEKTSRHYKMIDGTPYAIPGDYGRLEADGTLTLLGRGSSVINTGGEKVHPEEVEDIIKQLAGIDDCLAFGLPHQRFGQQIAVLVQLAAGIEKTSDEIVTHVKQYLAGYKAPREVIFVSEVPRGPNGKGDFKRAVRLAEDALDNPNH